MSFQKCPVCDGSGEVFRHGIALELVKCTVCHGEKIIDSKSGRPPERLELATPKILGNEELKMIPESLERWAKKCER